MKLSKPIFLAAGISLVGGAVALAAIPLIPSNESIPTIASVEEAVESAPIAEEPAKLQPAIEDTSVSEPTPPQGVGVTMIVEAPVTVVHPSVEEIYTTNRPINDMYSLERVKVAILQCATEESTKHSALERDQYVLMLKVAMFGNHACNRAGLRAFAS